MKYTPLRTLNDIYHHKLVLQGDHLPVAPPMPEAIAKSIEYQRSLPPSEEELVEQQRAKVFAKQY